MTFILMFGLFKIDPKKKKQQHYEKLMREARDIQRSGDLKLYAKKIVEAEVLAEEIEEMNRHN